MANMVPLQPEPHPYTAVRELAPTQCSVCPLSQAHLQGVQVAADLLRHVAQQLRLARPE